MVLESAEVRGAWKYLINIEKYLENQASLIPRDEISYPKVLAPRQSLLQLLLAPWADCIKLIYLYTLIALYNLN